MKSKIVVILTLLILAGVGTWWATSQRSMEHNDHGKSETEKKAQYICPMHPQIISDKPGACPVCGMDLVPTEEMEEHSDHSHDEHQSSVESSEKQMNNSSDEMTTHETSQPQGRTDIRLSLDKQQMIGVKIETAQKKKLFKSIRAPGRIAFDPELYTAQSEYLEALKQWRRVKDSPITDVKENTRQMIRSSKIRLKVLGLSDSEISRLASKGSQSEGLLVGGKDNLVYADVFEVDLPYIKVGQAAQISANFLQGKTLPGKVISVDQVIDPETRTAKVRIQLMKSDPSIRPESYVNLTIFAPVGIHTSVPLEAVMDTGVDTYVFVDQGEGRFEPRNIKIVLETESEAAIASGITPGEKVVVGANFLMDSESRLRSVIKKGVEENSGHNH